MPHIPEDLFAPRRPTAERPLLGQTVLVVEDSRFACEAMRILCLRSGARIRRADSLRAAARHLSVYRPTVAVIDLGLPDGSGLGLVKTLSQAQPRLPVVLATSGDDTLRDAALSAGANDFLSKPLTSLAAFQSAVLAHLPPETRPKGPRGVPSEAVEPDPIALRDDLAHVAELLARSADPATLDYAAQFLAGLAVSAGDDDLGSAAGELATSRTSGRPVDGILDRVSRLIGDRIALSAAV